MLIGFAGMTHLGIVSAAAAAAKGFDVVGYDADRALIAALAARRPPVSEPGLPELLRDHADRLRFSADLATLRRCDIVVIAADVPTDHQAHSDLAPISALIAEVGGHLAADAVMVVLCQVPPGFTAAIDAVPSERLFYQVETLVFGRAVDRALRPERIIVGCADPAVSLPDLYLRLLRAFDCPLLPMRYESAELAKIAINCCLVASISTANMLAELSEAIGADWAEIVPALRLDQRIGAYSYLSPGLGIAGGNLERDLRTVLDIGARHGTDTGLASSWLANSTYRKDWCWRILRDHVLHTQPDATIGVMGLAYKENTHSTKNSPALALLAHLERNPVRVHDPVVPSSVVPFAIGCSRPLAVAEGADAVVVATPWPCYRDVRLADLARVMAGRTIIDPYRLLDPSDAVALGLRYYALGRPPIIP